MKTIIKGDLQQRLSKLDRVVIELGCGQNKKSGRIGIDRIDLPGVDIVCDLEEGLPFLPENSVDEIHAISIFEHIHNFEFLMSEIVRVLKIDGKCRAVIPHFSNPYFYSDYSHKIFFGLYTFRYFMEEDKQLKRKVPNFYTTIRINIIKENLIFTSPFKGRKLFKKLMGTIINSNNYFKEWYEENLCYIFPCYAIEIVFSPDNKKETTSIYQHN